MKKSYNQGGRRGERERENEKLLGARKRTKGN